MNIAFSIIILSLVIALGKILGTTKFRKISIGGTWILFVGIVFSHFGYRLDPQVLHFMKEFGLILFVYSIGMQVGPSFFSSFAAGGLKLNALASIIVGLAVIVTIALTRITGTPIETMVGIMSGAVTNTPGLGAAQQAYTDVHGTGAGQIALGYAVAYPLGVIGCILSMLAIKSFFNNKALASASSEEKASNEDEKTQVKSGEENGRGNFTQKKIIISKRKLNGQVLGKLAFDKYLGATVTGIRRAGISIVPTENTRLQLGDIVTVAGSEIALSNVEKVLGNSQKRLDQPNLIAIFAGISLGCLLGSIPFNIPGVPQPVKLGLAGGPLIVSILISCFGPKFKIVTYTTTSANLMIREIGISLFLACVGLEAGTGFVDTIVNKGGYIWILYGAIITVVPLLIAGIIGRLMKINYNTLIGVLSGASTNPPALAFAGEQAKDSDEPAIGYATVYPLTMFLRVLVAQMMILVV